MNPRLLPLLRCPFCGAALAWSPLAGVGDGAGKLLCDCCAYPVVEGIPFVRTGALAREALRCLDRGEVLAALMILLEVPEPGRAALVEFLRDPHVRNFQDTLARLPAGAEGVYLLHRFSDPTFLVGEAALRAWTAGPGLFGHPALDVGGGAGHLTRALHRLAGGQDVVLADLAFWKLWLARRFVAPGCLPVCCDANVPLPFVAGAFRFVFSSDAFHYIWSKRLLADELMRAAGEDGLVRLAHLHNALADNPSAGMPLAPAGWRRLFHAWHPRLFGETPVLDALLSGKPIDLGGAGAGDADLAAEPSLLLAAGGREPVHAAVSQGKAPALPAGGWRFNPLYRQEPAGDAVRLTLQFPSADYAEEFGGGRRYLPVEACVSPATVAAMRGGPGTAELDELVARRVVLDLPEHYLP